MQGYNGSVSKNDFFIQLLIVSKYVIKIEVDCIPFLRSIFNLTWIEWDTEQCINLKIAGYVHQELKAPCCSPTLGSYHGLGYHLRRLVYHQESYDMPRCCLEKASRTLERLQKQTIQIHEPQWRWLQQHQQRPQIQRLSWKINLIVVQRIRFDLTWKTEIHSLSSNTSYLDFTTINCKVLIFEMFVFLTLF